MQESYNIRLTLWWIWMLIYGMVLMEEVIKKLVKSTLQEKLEKYTKNKWNSFLLWIWATGITQSSSLVSLLLLVFVWAWIIALPSAVWVIIWSNIWTTFSSMIIALLWFGKFSITAFAFPLIAIGGLGLLFVKNKKRKYYLKLLLSFWLLFFWIDLIKDSVEMLKAVIDFTQYAHWWVLGFFFLWVIVTAVVQSSHTVVIMTLAALHGWIITFPMALWVVIGSNIWTTVTVLFASIWWSRAKKNVAFAHLGFNCILSVIWLLYYPWITWIVTEWMWLQNNPIIALAVFNTVLNAITALIVLPFLWQFVQYVTKYTSKKGGDNTSLHAQRLLGSENLMDAFPSISLRALHLDTKDILINACRYTLQLFDHDIITSELIVTKNIIWKQEWLLSKIKKWFGHWTQPEAVLPREQSIEETSYDQQQHKALYDTTKQTIECILPILLQLEQQELSETEHHKQWSIKWVINSCIEVMKYGKAIREDMEALRASTWWIKTYYEDRQEHIVGLCSGILSMLQAKTIDYEKIRETLWEEKSQYKDQRKKSTQFLTTISQKSAGKIALSTLFNIEKHILSMEKHLLKSWKSRGKSIAKSAWGFDWLVDDLYDEWIIEEDTTSNE